VGMMADNVDRVGEKLQQQDLNGKKEGGLVSHRDNSQKKKERIKEKKRNIPRNAFPRTTPYPIQFHKGGYKIWGEKK